MMKVVDYISRLKRVCIHFPQVLCFFAIFVFPVLAQDLDDKDCIDCHAKDKPTVDEKILKESVHEDIACTDCHDSITSYPHEEKIKKVDCSECHDEAASDYAQSIHFKMMQRNVPDLPTCSSCHGKHDIFKVSDARSFVHRLRVDKACLSCHADEVITKRHPHIPTPEYVERYEGSVHGRGVHIKGLVVSATCSDCHGAHKIQSKGEESSSINRANIPYTCKKCHLGIFNDFEKSTHGKLWKEGKSEGPVCTSCHEAHKIDVNHTKTFRMEGPKGCGGCHEEEESSYEDTFHGKATSLGYIVAAQCADCHTAHTNLPKDDPKSSVHPNNLKKTCGKCHKNTNDNFIQYNPHLDPSDKENSPVVYYVHFFMKWLLILVMLFFGGHTLLWLQRAVVSVWTGKTKRHQDSTQYVQRFNKTTIMLHITVIISFLGLAATGIPLKYHSASWAKALETVMGGVEVARYFHRVCAIITFGYALVHLSQLYVLIIRKRQFQYLYGPDSLVPRWKDLIDFLHNLRWFFYLGPKPKFGRWAYFEKFDYFAIFWGIPVIGLSGLIMWFPSFFTSFLPGVVLNLALIIHSEEALLAASFIFTIHFFHNHLRPENFPLDTTIFTGKVPLERFIEERPEEYEILKTKNKLDDIIVDPPSAIAIRLSRIFGFSALTVGVILILTIMIAICF